MSTQIDSVHIDKVPDAETLSKRVFELFLQEARDSVHKKGSFYIALSGGHTPERFYRLLGESKKALDLPWDHIHIFWADERAVPPSDPASNYLLAAETFLEKSPIPRENIHPAWGVANDLQQAARQYEQTIRDVFSIPTGQFPVFDLILLGMGADGHVASLLPNSTALLDTTDLVGVVFQMEQDWSRLTLTAPVISAARKIIVLVSGKEKASIVNRVFSEKPDELSCPAHILWPVLDRVLWIIDEDAARLLK